MATEIVTATPATLGDITPTAPIVSIREQFVAFWQTEIANQGVLDAKHMVDRVHACMTLLTSGLPRKEQSEARKEVLALATVHSRLVKETPDTTAPLGEWLPDVNPDQQGAPRTKSLYAQFLTPAFALATIQLKVDGKQKWTAKERQTHAVEHAGYLYESPLAMLESGVPASVTLTVWRNQIRPSTLDFATLPPDDNRYAAAFKYGRENPGRVTVRTLVDIKGDGSVLRNQRKAFPAVLAGPDGRIDAHMLAGYIVGLCYGAYHPDDEKVLPVAFSPEMLDNIDAAVRGDFSDNMPEITAMPDDDDADDDGNSETDQDTPGE